MGRKKPKPESSAPTPTASEPLELPWWGVVLGFVAVAGLFCLPVLESGSAFGIDDWDQQLFYLESARRSLLVYHQIPWWDPWYCGGSPLLANPSSNFLDPLLLVLALGFGVLWAGKLSIVVHQVVGMVGAFLLARRLGARGVPALLSGVIFGCSSVFTLHLATGHVNWLALGWLPFAALFTCGAVDAAAVLDYRRAAAEALLAGLATALLLFTGNAYFFVYQCLFVALYGVLTAVASGPLRRMASALGAGLAVGLATCAFAAVKLVPMAGFLGAVSRYEAKDESGATVGLLWASLLGRDQGLTSVQVPGMQWRYWEYGSYVGIAALLLATVAVALSPRKAWRWAVIGLFFTLFAMGNGGPVWPLMRLLRGFEGLRVPARAIAYAVLAIAGLAALGASRLEQLARERWPAHGSRILAATAILAALVTLDFFVVTRPVLAEAFALPAIDLTEAPARSPIRQVRGAMAFHTRARYTDHLDHALRNEGVINCYDRLHLPIAARAQTGKDGAVDPLYRGEAWIDGTQGAAAPTLSFSPNRLVIDIPAASGGTLVVNQNADSPWSATVRDSAEPLAPQQGLLAVALPSDGQPASVVFEYRPSRWGALVTLLALLFAAAWLVCCWRRDAKVARPN
jgi:hypothetical protein